MKKIASKSNALPTGFQTRSTSALQMATLLLALGLTFGGGCKTNPAPANPNNHEAGSASDASTPAETNAGNNGNGGSGNSENSNKTLEEKRAEALPKVRGQLGTLIDGIALVEASFTGLKQTLESAKNSHNSGNGDLSTLDFESALKPYYEALYTQKSAEGKTVAEALEELKNQGKDSKAACGVQFQAWTDSGLTGEVDPKDGKGEIDLATQKNNLEGMHQAFLGEVESALANCQAVKAAYDQALVRKNPNAAKTQAESAWKDISETQLQAIQTNFNDVVAVAAPKVGELKQNHASGEDDLSKSDKAKLGAYLQAVESELSNTEKAVEEVKMRLETLKTTAEQQVQEWQTSGALDVTADLQTWLSTEGEYGKLAAAITATEGDFKGLQALRDRVHAAHAAKVKEVEKAAAAKAAAQQRLAAAQEASEKYNQGEFKATQEAFKTAQRDTTAKQQAHQEKAQVLAGLNTQLEEAKKRLQETMTAVEKAVEQETQAKTTADEEVAKKAKALDGAQKLVTKNGGNHYNSLTRLKRTQGEYDTAVKAQQTAVEALETAKTQAKETHKSAEKQAAVDALEQQVEPAKEAEKTAKTAFDQAQQALKTAQQALTAAETRKQQLEAAVSAAQQQEEPQ